MNFFRTFTWLMIFLVPSFCLGNVKINAINFNCITNGTVQLKIKFFPQPSSYQIYKSKNTIKILFKNAVFSRWLLKDFSVSEFSTIVNGFSAENKKNDALLTVRLNGKFKVHIKKSRKAIKLFIKGKKDTAKEKLYSLNLQAVPIPAALQQLAKIANINIVILDSVKGKITLELRNLTWQNILKILLRTSNLTETKIGKTYIIGSKQDIQKQGKSMRQPKALSTLRTQFVSIFNNSATDIAKLLSQNKQFSNATIGVDKEHNALLITAPKQQLDAILKMIKQLDKPVKQVLIEARIVNIDKSIEKQLGIRWGISNAKGISGTLKGASQMRKGVVPSDIGVNQRLNVDLPAFNVGQIAGASSIGLALAKLGSGYLLDLELSALQNNGEAKIISSPKLITENRQQAIIETGEEIPFQKATHSGATAVAFKKAVLSLKVRPEVTASNRIILDLQVNQDKRGPEIVAGIPSIDTREIKTQVLVNNGQTIVLGGIIQQSNNKQAARVPFLGDLPLIGHLFRNQYKRKKKSELLIFVTPKIVK